MPRNTCIANKELRYAITKMMGEFGIKRTAELLDMSRQTIERAAGGLTIQSGSELLLMKKMATRTDAHIRE